MKLGIYGAGGEGREVKEAAQLQNEWEALVFIDDTLGAGVLDGCPRLPFAEFCKLYPAEEIPIVVAVGEPCLRALLCKRASAAGYRFANVIHPAATVSPTAVLGRGITVKSGAFLSAAAEIGDNVGIGAGAIVSHDTVVERDCQISPNVALGGHCRIGTQTFLGMGACVRQGVEIGARCIIGMGAVVTKNIPDDTVAYGNPARAVRPSGERVFK